MMIFSGEGSRWMEKEEEDKCVSSNQSFAVQKIYKCAHPH